MRKTPDSHPGACVALAVPSASALGRRDGCRRTAQEEGRRREEDVHGQPRPGRPLGRRAGHDRRQEDDHDRRRRRRRSSGRSRRSRCPVYPDHTDRSVFISEQALPMPRCRRRCRRRARTSTSSPARPTRAMRSGSRCRRRSRRRRLGRQPRCRASRRVEHVMGMPIVDRRARRRRRRGSARPAFDWFRAVDARFSTYKDDSEITRLNRGELALADAHPDVREVLARCERAARARRGGYFDARAAVAPALDPSGLVKGWSVDRVAAIARRGGAAQLRDQRRRRHASARARRSRTPLAGRHPAPARCGDKVAAVVVADDLAIATSGAYARGEHVVDPHTGRPPRGVLSVTITGPDLATADAYATAAFAMGAARPGLDGAAPRLRGDDDPRRRACALDPRVPLELGLDGQDLVRGDVREPASGARRDSAP